MTTNEWNKMLSLAAAGSLPAPAETDYSADAYSARRAIALAKLASKGRAWLVSEAAKLKSSIAGYRITQYEDGLYACMTGQLADLRAAWKMTAEAAS
jgi:hypothetical protein